MKPTLQAFTTIIQNKTQFITHEKFVSTKYYTRKFLRVWLLSTYNYYVFAYFMFCCLITNRELYNNRISSLPSDVFKDLYSIRDLFIEHNSISSIPLKTF